MAFLLSVSTNALATAARQSVRILLWQALWIGALATIFAVTLGTKAAVSALVGGGIGLVWTVYMALVLFKHSLTYGVRLSAISFFAGWLFKVVVTVSLLVIALRSKALTPLFVLAGLFGAMVALLVVVCVREASMRMTLMASESGGDHGGGLSGYIAHHLTHLASDKQSGLFDISVVHWDTLFFSLLCAAIVLLAFGLAARRATAGVPGKFQSAVEMLVEMVDEQAKTLVKGKLTYIAPLALTVFAWVTLMNAIDLLPVDWLPSAAHKAVGVEYLRPLPTADINATLGMAVGTLLLVFYYSLKIKGPAGWAHELVMAPFGMVKLSANPLTWIGALLLAVANLGMNIVEYVAARCRTACVCTATCTPASSSSS